MCLIKTTSSLYHDLYLAHAARCEREAARAAVTGALLPALLRGYRSAQQAEQPSGWTRLARCRRALEALDRRGWQRSFHQRQFHEYFIRASMRVFWKPEPPGQFSRDHRAILEFNGWDSLPQEMLVSTPRRFGKTISVRVCARVCVCCSWSGAHADTRRVQVSMFAAAMLYAAPGVEVSIYSTCLRISHKLLRNITKFLQLIFEGLDEEPFPVASSNMEELRVRGCEGDLRVVNSYPSKVPSVLRSV